MARPHWPGRRRAEGASDLPERIRLGASADEGHADAGGGFDDACGELDQARLDGSELAVRSAVVARHRVAQSPSATRLSAGLCLGQRRPLVDRPVSDVLQ